MNEHRNSPRIEQHSDVTVKIQSAPEARSLEGLVFPFHSEDISLYGMRLDVDVPVPIGTLLELEVTLTNSSMKYRHLGNVIWAEASEEAEPESSHDLGVRLHSQSNPQFDSWAAALSSL